jgi:glycosyltransferase involved in cell wall biosynthesis
MKQKTSILFLSPYPLKSAPSQRFRFELFLDKIQTFSIDILTLYSSEEYIFLRKTRGISKILIVLKAQIKRIRKINSIAAYEFIFIHREATSIGPPIFEWLIAKILKKKIIYDFDDAIWLEDPEEKGTFKSWLKNKGKIKKIISWSYRVSAGNAFLAEYAKNYNSDVRILPTVVDTENYHNPDRFNIMENERPVIGWTGSHTTLQYLTDIVHILNELNSEVDFTCLVICDKKPEFDLPNLRWINWNMDSEIEDLLKIDIGIMPLTDDEWSKGKCGFKLIQYMALSKPVVADAVGENIRIVDHGKNGFLCHSPEDWKSHLKYLLLNRNERREFGKKGREKIKRYYSVDSVKTDFLALFE